MHFKYNLGQSKKKSNNRKIMEFGTIGPLESRTATDDNQCELN